MEANTDLAALLRTCKDEPDDDAPRLILADWLQDHGQPERAEYIRRQLQMPEFLGDEDPPDLSWLGAWGKWAKTENDERYGMERVGFCRGLIHVLSHGSMGHDLRPFLAAPFCWDWVESIHCMWWGGETDWPRLLNSPKVHELSSLGFGGDYCGPDFALMFAAAQSLPRLTKLSLGHLNMSDAQVAMLCQAGLSGLTKLSLSVNRITTKGVSEIVRNPQWLGLRRLDLSCNQVCNAVAGVFTEGPPRPALRYLGLAGCQIRDTGLIRLASSDRLPNLEVLNLGGNRITDRGVHALLGLQRQRPLTVGIGSSSCLASAYRNELQARFGEHIWIPIGQREPR